MMHLTTISMKYCMFWQIF